MSIPTENVYNTTDLKYLKSCRYQWLQKLNMLLVVIQQKGLIKVYDNFSRMSVIEKEDWKSITDLVTNAKEVVSSVQDVARKLADYTNFRGNKSLAGKPFCCTGSKLIVLGRVDLATPFLLCRLFLGKYFSYSF